MQRMAKFALVCLIVCAGLFVWADGGAGGGGSKGPSVRLPGAAFAALETINPEHIRWHVRFLSHDLLEGRGTGQRGGDLAAEYIATQFAEYGLKPAGDHGTYMQKVPLVGITTLPETRFSLVPKQGETMNLKLLDEYVAYNQTQQPESDVDAEIVFVGYGIEAPEYNWDDYKGVDVRGKVLLMLVNEPPSDDPKFFKGKALTYYGRWTYKYEEGSAQGRSGRDPDSSGGHGQLSVGSGAELEFRRKVVPEAGRAGAEGGIVDPSGCRDQAGIGIRDEPRQDDAGSAVARLSSGESRRATEGAHGQQGPEFRVEQRTRRFTRR